MKRITLNRINHAVAELGYKERLYRDYGYFHWYGGDAPSFEQSGVYVKKLSMLTLQQWVDDLRDKHNNL